MSNITLFDVRNKTSDARDIEEMRQFPLAIRDYLKNKKTNFDNLYDNRRTDEFLQRFKSCKYPIRDRSFGSPNEDICNIFLNIFNDKEVSKLIDQYTFDRKWIYHPVRKFEKWHTISKQYYNDESKFWLILIFNRIVDPFTALQDFNIVRIPEADFLQDIPYRVTFDYASARF